MSRSRFALMATLLLALPAAAKAQSTPDTSWLKKPYQLTIALHVEPHPLLTPVFLDRFQRELKDTLQRDLGTIGVVDVVTKHTLLDEVVKAGWGALDGLQTLGDRKVHLIKLTYHDGEYELHEVTLGREALGKVEVLAGLREGEDVVTDGVFTLKSLVLKGSFAEED